MSGERWGADVGTPVLAIDDVSLMFGGVSALDAVSLAVASGEVLAVIGPNGAGKSSLFNCVSGIYRPLAGSIKIGDVETTALEPWQISQLGLRRTFQNLGLFSSLDVVENLMLGYHSDVRPRLFADAMRIGRTARRDRLAMESVRTAMKRFGLDQYVGVPVGRLPYGVQKRIELVRASTGNPLLLMLDEPVAGMTEYESRWILDLLVELRDHGVTTVIVEHDMGFLMEAADRMVVMDFGRMVFAGTPAEVRQSEKVMSVYLGHPAAASEARSD